MGLRYNSDDVRKAYSVYKSLGEEGKVKVEKTYAEFTDFLMKSIYCDFDDDTFYVYRQDLENILDKQKFNWYESYDIVSFALFLGRIKSYQNMYRISKQW